MPLRRRTLALAGLALAGALAGCKDKLGPADPADAIRTVEIDPLPDTVGLGDTLALAARLTDDAGRLVEGATPAWRSGTPSTLRILSDGRAVAVAPGRAVLYAEVTGASRVGARDSVVLQVERLARAFTFTLRRDSLAVDDTMTVGIGVLDGAGVPMAAGALRFTSTDTMVLSVDSLGRVLTRGDGDAAVVVATGDASDTLPLHAYLRRVVVEDGAAMRRISIGRSHACALSTAGAAYCWGRNAPGIGEYGRGTSDFSATDSVALRVPNTPAFERLDADREGTCAVTATGELWCWGSWNLAPTSAERSFARRIQVPDSSRRFVQARHSTDGGVCAIDTLGDAWCWGSNTYGQFVYVEGEPGGVSYTVPRRIPGGIRWRDVKPGFEHSCGVDVDGGLWCWGAGWPYYGITSASGAFYYAPGSIPAPVRFTQVAVAISSTCALATDGGTWCFGVNTDGSLGNGTRGVPFDYATLEGVQPLPTRVTGAPPFVKLEARGFTTCGLTADGDLWCWGRRARGQSGTSVVPVRFSRRHRFVDFAVSGNGPCGVTAEGQVLCTRVHAYNVW